MTSWSTERLHRAAENCSNSLIASRYESGRMGADAPLHGQIPKEESRQQSGERMGASSATPFLDEIAEAGLVTSGDFAHEVAGQLQVALRAGQADMSKIRGQEWQLRAEVDILFTPQQKPEDPQTNVAGHGAECGYPLSVRCRRLSARDETHRAAR